MRTFEINVKSTPDDRYDGVVGPLVREVLDAEGIHPLWDEGGCGFDGTDTPADNQWGFYAADENAARAVAEKVKAAVGERPVQFYVSVSDANYKPGVDDTFHVVGREA
jgi:hypothetical protein